MAWLEVHQGLREHRKLYACADDLAVEPVTMLGMLVSLWLWALDNVQDGNLAGISNRSVARAARWPEKKADKLMAALIANRWIDQDGESLSIHDWAEYTGRLMDGRKKDAERKRKKREEKKRKESGPDAEHPKTSAGRPADIQRTSAACPEKIRCYSNNNNNSNSTVPTSSVSPNGATEEGNILPGAETAPGRSHETDLPQPMIAIPMNDGAEYPIYPQNVSEWKDLYPAVDIMAELRKMRGWSLANPKKRKTKGGIMRFVNAWLAKAQDACRPKEGANGNDAGRDEKASAEYGICL